VTDSSDTYSILIKAPLKNTALRTAMTSVTSTISTTNTTSTTSTTRLYIHSLYLQMYHDILHIHIGS